ncbi:MAG: hypothetical protein AAF430_16095 [Myxococcota bacterium]
MASGEQGAWRRPLRRLLLTGVVLLYILSIPWYRESGAEPAIWFGLPDWVAVAIGCYVGAAILNASAWMLSDLRDPGEGETEESSA